MNDDSPPGGVHVTGYTTGVKDSDFLAEVSLGHARVQFAVQLVVQEEGPSFGPQNGSGYFDNGFQLIIQCSSSSHSIEDIEQELGHVPVLGGRFC